MPLPPIRDANEFLAAKIAEPKRLIHGCCDVGDKFGIIGGSKTYKSWNLMQLSMQLARRDKPGDWLGFKVEPATVLYLNFELPEWYFQHRLEAFRRALGIQGDLHLRVWQLKGYENLTRYDTFIPELRQRIVGTDINVISLDPLYKIYPPDMKENDNGACSTMMATLSTLVRGNACSLIFTHHMPKGDMTTRDPIDRAAGAGVLIRDVDGMCFFTRVPKKPKHFTAHYEFRNHPCVEPFTVTWDFPLFTRDGESAPTTSTSEALSDTQATLLSLIPTPTPYEAWKRDAEALGVKGGAFSRLVGILEKLGFASYENGKWNRVDKPAATDYRDAASPDRGFAAQASKPSIPGSDGK